MRVATPHLRLHAPTWSEVLRGLGFWVTALSMTLAFLFLAGETSDDPGGWAAVGYVAAWAAPLAALLWLAVRRPEWADPLLLGALALPVAFALWSALHVDSWRDFTHDVGPVGAVLVMVMGTAAAFLGRHPEHTRSAGWTMIGLTLAPAAIMLVSASHLMASTVTVSLPVLVTGLLYVLATTPPRGHGSH